MVKQSPGRRRSSSQKKKNLNSELSLPFYTFFKKKINLFGDGDGFSFVFF